MAREARTKSRRLVSDATCVRRRPPVTAPRPMPCRARAAPSRVSAASASGGNSPVALSVLARQRRQKTRDRNSRTKTFQIIEEKISRNSHAKAWMTRVSTRYA